MTARKVLFPNPFGGKKAKKAVVAALRKEHAFSDAYAAFLVDQGGFFPRRLEGAKNGAAYLATPEAKRLRGPDLAELHDAEGAGTALARLRALSSYFFPIGKSYGGDAYVEVLRGRYRGFIACLNHEMYLGVRSLEGLVEDTDGFFEETFGVDFFDAPMGKQADMLAAEGLDLVSFCAPSFDEFIAACVFCDEELRGRVRTTSDLVARKAAAKALKEPAKKPEAKRVAKKKPAKAAVPELPAVGWPKGKLSASQRRYLESARLPEDVVAFYEKNAPRADVAVGHARLLAVSSMQAAEQRSPGRTLRIFGCTVLATTARDTYFYTRSRTPSGYQILRLTKGKLKRNPTKGELLDACSSGPAFESIAAFITAFMTNDLPR